MPIQTALTLTGTMLLAWAMIQDVKTRQVPNKVWLTGLVVMVPIRIGAHIQAPAPLWIISAWGVGLCAVSIFLYATGNWQGADAKATLLLAWVLPLYEIQGAWVHPLLYVLPVSLGLAAAWTRLRPGPMPFFTIYSPVTASFLVAFWIWKV